MSTVLTRQLPEPLAETRPAHRPRPAPAAAPVGADPSIIGTGAAARITPTPKVSTRLTSTRLVVWFALLSLIPMAVAHVIGAAVVDPLINPISWYAFVPGGGAMIIAGGALLALLGLVLTIRLYRSGLAAGPVPALAMIIFAAAMIMVGLFPTDPPGSDLTVSATVHRISAAAAFVVLPLVGIWLARSIRQPVSVWPGVLCRAAILLGALVATFLIVHLSLVITGSGLAAFGLLERVGFMIMIGYLFLLAATIDREAGRHSERPGRSARGGDQQFAGLGSAGASSPRLRRHTSAHGVGASPRSVSAALESTSYGRWKM